MSQTSENAPPETNVPYYATLQADEQGALKGLEPHAPYFVVKRPTLPRPEGATRMRTVMEELRAILLEHAALAQKQARQLNDRLGDPVARVKQARETAEKKVDEVARKLETRYEKLENDLEANLDRLLRRKNGDGAADEARTPQPETPGEIPTGEHAEAATVDKPARKTAKKAP